MIMARYGQPLGLSYDLHSAWVGERPYDGKHLQPEFELPEPRAPAAAAVATEGDAADGGSEVPVMPETRDGPTVTEDPGTPDETAIAGASRQWTSADGRFRVEAEFIKAIGGMVYLKRNDNGKEVKVPIQDLSEEDQRWLKNKGS
jgi:hypothetical protein